MYRTASPGPVAPAARTRSEYPWIVLLLAALLGVWYAHERHEEHTLRTLPPPARTALLRGALGTLRTVCPAATQPQLVTHCADQAALALRLPECDARCQALARAHLVRPTR